MKYSQLLGVLAAITLAASCFVKWTWYPDLDSYFTAFYSLDNVYGKPGKVFIFFIIVASVFYLTPRIWAKRWNMMVCGLNLAYAIKTFILFSSCYLGICPEKQIGIWVMLASSVMMMIVSLLPDLRISNEISKDSQNKPDTR